MMPSSIFHISSIAPDRPLLIWDGNCGFCKYWVIRWKKMTGDQVFYSPYQRAANDFPEIPKKEFKKAAFLLSTDGLAYRGAAAIYKTITFSNNWRFLFDWYRDKPFFRAISDKAYQWVVSHRPFMMKITTLLWGKHPSKPKPYWLLWLVGMVLFFFFCFLAKKGRTLMVINKISIAQCGFRVSRKSRYGFTKSRKAGATA